MVERYNSYKGSGVTWLEEVPEHWKEKRIKELVLSFEQGWSPNAAGWCAEKGDFGVLKLSAISNGMFHELNNKSLEIDRLPQNTLLTKKGTILITRSNTPALVADSCLVRKNPYTNLVVPDLVFCLTFNVKFVDLEFMSYSLNSSSFRWLKTISARGLNDSMVKVSQRIVKNWAVFIPPIPEQSSIAKYLNTKTAQIDRKIELLRQKVEKYDKLKQSLIYETVTHGLDKSVPMKDSAIDWIGEVPARWEVKPIRDFLENRTEKNLGNAETEYLSVVAGIGVIPYAEKGDVGNKKPEDLGKCKLVQPGDLVLNSMNFGIGSFGISKYKGVCSSVYIVMRAMKNNSPDFLHRIFQI